MEPDSDFVAVLRRWEDAGGVWRVLGRDADAVTVGLYRCDGGEETDRFVASDPRLAEFLARRTSSEDQPRAPHDVATGSGSQQTGEVIVTQQDVPDSRVHGIDSVALCPTAVLASSRCRRSRCHRSAPWRLRTSC